jgi:hypothetical protein
MKRDNFACSKREITVRIKSNWQMCILSIECKSVWKNRAMCLTTGEMIPGLARTMEKTMKLTIIFS